MTPLSCSLIVRALAGPALVNDPLSCSSQYEHLWVLRCFTNPPFLLSASIAILVLSTTRETKLAWYCSLRSSPIGRLLIRVGASRRTPFCVVFGCHALHKPSPHGLGCSCALACVSSVFRILTSNRSSPTPSLQSLTLATWR